MAEKSLTTIARKAKELYQSLPKGSPESNKAFEIWRLADEGDARTLSDEPKVAKAKRKRAKKTTA